MSVGNRTSERVNQTAASESAMATGALVNTIAAGAAEGLAVAGFGLTVFATTAQILAYIHCSDVKD